MPNRYFDMVYMQIVCKYKKVSVNELLKPFDYLRGWYWVRTNDFLPVKQAL